LNLVNRLLQVTKAYRGGGYLEMCLIKIHDYLWISLSTVVNFNYL